MLGGRRGADAERPRLGLADGAGRLQRNGREEDEHDANHDQ